MSTRVRIPLVEGVHMKCPRCKEPQHILRFIPLMEIEEFISETNPIYKCPECRWIFSPAEYRKETYRP